MAAGHESNPCAARQQFKSDTSSCSRAACMQDPATESGKKLQDELAGLVAAAVHQGYISVQEGVADALDSMWPFGVSSEEGEEAEADEDKPDQTSSPPTMQDQWGRCLAERYMDMPGKPDLAWHTALCGRRPISVTVFALGRQPSWSLVPVFSSKPEYGHRAIGTVCAACIIPALLSKP